MTDTQAKNIYFLGIGGIGMSAIARYYLLEGVRVGGYDRTETALTRALASEGADIHYEDDPARIAAPFRNPDDTLVVYTPAIPHDHAETAWFRSRGFRMLKRSEILGVLAADKYVMAVAGTHGKTTTTTLTAWLNHVAGGGGSAFLGGMPWKPTSSTARSSNCGRTRRSSPPPTPTTSTSTARTKSCAAPSPASPDR